MKKLSKSKKLVAILLLICLSFVMVGCGTTNNLDENGKYIVDENSTCARIVGSILDALQSGLSHIGLENYIYAIIALTLIVKILTTPLNIKQQKSMKAMMAVNPKMQELNIKYANVPQKKQEEMMKLYRENHVSPTAGCLPMLIQMPILFILFYGMRNWLPPQEIIDAGLYSFLWIKDLSLTVKLTPYHWFLPIACAVVTMAQQFMSTSNRQDTTQKMMLLMMPLMFLFITQQFPSALAVYWLFYGLFTMFQTTWLNYRLKTGFFTPKEEKALSKQAITELKEKQERKEEKAHSGKSGKSGTTHNKSQKNDEVMAQNADRKRAEDTRDKPWH